MVSRYGDDYEEEFKREATKITNILIVGASGRVGGSAMQAIRNKRYAGFPTKVSVGGRKRATWESYKNAKTLDGIVPQFADVEFIEMDITKEEDIETHVASGKYDLVIHTAGPFQGLQYNALLECCLSNGVDYLDVCDDINLSRIVRSERYQALAIVGNATAVISTGIWPGGSSLFAQHIIEEHCEGPEEVDEVLFSFFTAGSGGAGPTILSATFLILGEDVLTYKQGEEVFKSSATDAYSIDFGPGIGKREVARLNLIECESCHVTGVQTVQTFFGTAPPFWNTLFVLMAKLIPQRVLQNRNAMDALAKVSLPMVRLVDQFVGSKNAIRVDVTTKSGKKVTGIMSHADMEKAVGDAIAAFACEMVLAKNRGRLKPGVYFPEEVQDKVFRAQILEEIKKDAMFYSDDYKNEMI